MLARRNSLNRKMNESRPATTRIGADSGRMIRMKT
jgi:hypothetical protein